LTLDTQNGAALDSYRLVRDDEYVSSESLAAFADGVSQYVDESSSMNAGRFPKEFQIVWRQHMRAWDDYAEFLQSAGNKRIRVEEFEARSDVYNAEIATTWYEVLRVARENGADLPADF
jgi:hypothetical protein